MFKKLSKKTKGILAALFIIAQFPFWLWFTNWGEGASQAAWNTLGIVLATGLLITFLYFVRKNRM